MKMKTQHDNVVDFSSIAVKLAAIKASEIERSQLQELNYPEAFECPHCQLENAISISLELAISRDQLLIDSNFNLTEEDSISLTEERNAFIIHAYESVMQLYDICEE
jgi:hypothetical protein